MIFEALGLRGVAERGYSIMVFGGHARAWLPERYTGGEDSGPTRLGTRGGFSRIGNFLGRRARVFPN